MAEVTDKKKGKSESDAGAVEANHAEPTASDRVEKWWRRVTLPVAVGAATVIALSGVGIMFLGGDAHPEHLVPKLQRARFAHPWSEAITCSVPLWTAKGNSIAKVEISFVYEARVEQAELTEESGHGHGDTHGDMQGATHDDTHGDGHTDTHNKATAGGHGQQDESTTLIRPLLFPEDLVVTALRTNWDRMMKGVVPILMSCERADLFQKSKREQLEMRLVNELNRLLFPDNEAEVKQILWK